MKSYQRSHLADDTLLRNLAANTARARDITADQIADIGEVEARRLYRPAGYPSMFQYCVHELHLSEQAAFRRILVARKARRFPAIFHAIADGRLHLTAIVLLSRYLTQDTADELLAAATHKTKAEIEVLLATRFPQPDLATILQPIEAPRQAAGNPPVAELSPAIVSGPPLATELTPPAEAPVARVTPLAPERFALQVTIGKEAHDLLRQAQDLLGHRVPSGDVEAVLTLALRGLVQKLEQRKFGATERPRPSRPRSTEGRHLPADVRRVVWRRDGGQCTFVSDTGQRCTARRDVEFDHVEPYARDGDSSIGNVRLLCRAHNQLEAEHRYGAEFVRHKRIAAAEARAGAGG